MKRKRTSEMGGGADVGIDTAVENDLAAESAVLAHAADSEYRMQDLHLWRRRFLEAGEAGDAVRPLVKNSWARCRAYGVDPYHLHPQRPDPSFVDDGLVANHALLACVDPYLRLVHETLGSQPHLVALSDRNARILRLLADPVSACHRDTHNFFPGASWHERDIGCNGIGTALATGEAVILIGPEHFQEAYVGWTCIGIPLHAEDGVVVGALDLSVPNEHVQTHTWGWVLSLAQAIEGQLVARSRTPSQPAGAPDTGGVPGDLAEPFHAVRGVLELLASQVQLSPTHAALLAEARQKAQESERSLRLLATELLEGKEELRESDLQLQDVIATVRRRSADAEEKSRMLDAIMTYVPEGITIADAPDITVRRVSAYGRRLSGRTAEEIEGIPVTRHAEEWGLFYADGVTPARNEDLPLTRATLHGDVVSNEEWVLRRPDGTKVPILCSAGPIRDDAGVITGGVIAWRDMTDLKEAQEALRAREERLREMNEELERRVAERTASLEQRSRDLQSFAFVASHDLQEPLRKIQAFAGIMKDECADQLDDSGRFYLDRMESAAARMSKLLSDILTFSRMATHGQPLTEVNIDEVVREVVGDLDMAISREGAVIEFDADVSLPADHNQIRQLVNQLVINAIKFRRTDVQPIVRISASIEDAPSDATSWAYRDGVLRLVVEDNGIGFEKQYAERIFEPFQRLHGRGVYPGTGMGLAICRRIVERHGGTFDVESVVGEGSRFIVTLPLRQSAGDDATGLAR